MAKIFRDENRVSCEVNNISFNTPGNLILHIQRSDYCLLVKKEFTLPNKEIR